MSLNPPFVMGSPPIPTAYPLSEPMSADVIRINVVLNTHEITQCFKNIILMMEARIANADVEAYRSFDSEGAMMRWYEALDHYLSFQLSRSNASIGIEYYVAEYFACVARYLNDHDFYRAVGIQFAQAAGLAAQALFIARERIEQAGGAVDEVEFTPHGLRQGCYLVTGTYTPSELGRGNSEWAVQY